MQIFRLILLLLALSFFKSIAQPYKILESTKEHIIIEFDFHNYYTIADTIINGKRFNYINQMEFSPRMPGEPWLPELLINIGVPNKCNPSLSILNSEEIKINDKFIIPFPKEDPDITPKGEDNFNFEIYNSNRLFPFTKAKIINDYIFRYSRVLVVGISPYQFNPISRDILFTNKMKIKIVFNSLNDLNDKKIEDAFTENYLQDLVINYEIMSDWITKEETQQRKFCPNNTLADFVLNYFLKEGQCNVVSYGLSSIQEDSGSEGLHNYKVRVGFQPINVDRSFVLHSYISPVKKQIGLLLSILLKILPKNRKLKKAQGIFNKIR